MEFNLELRDAYVTCLRKILKYCDEHYHFPKTVGAEFVEFDHDESLSCKKLIVHRRPDKTAVEYLIKNSNFVGSFFLDRDKIYYPIMSPNYIHYNCYFTQSTYDDFKLRFTDLDGNLLRKVINLDDICEEHFHYFSNIVIILKTAWIKTIKPEFERLMDPIEFDYKTRTSTIESLNNFEP